MIYARLIGIDVYKSGSRLFGCKNDVENMTDFLQGLNAGIVVSSLSDGDAHLTAVLDALAGDVGNLKRGDQLIVHFSGHGAQLYLRGVSCAAACPFNFSLADSASGIVEPDLQTVFAKLPPEARVTIFADCCFSGGLESNWVETFARRLGRSIRSVAAKAGLAARPLARVRRFAPSTVRAALPTASGGPDVVILAASGFTQESGEYDFGGAGAGGVQGVFTHYVIERLKAGNLREPATATRDGVRSLTEGKFEQQAELHGNTASWDKPLIDLARARDRAQPVLT